MTEHVLDASTAVAWYLPQRFSLDARKWQRDMLEQRVRFVVPRLHYWEVANVLRKYVRRLEVPPAEAEHIYSLHLEAPMETAEPDPGQVLEVALKYDTTAYDAVYIALSLSRNMPLVTAERATTGWVAKLGDLARPLGEP
jgi:predicted nucleic acid-binding protein